MLHIHTMKGTLTGAFATGAYAMIFTTIWIMSDLFSGARLSAFMVLAMVRMVVWLIVAHDLWEKPADRGSRYLAALYNGVTVLTLSVAILLSYAVLFALFLAAAGLFVPVGLFQSTVGHPVGLSDYLALTWLTASLATIAGALGSSLGDEETVREATLRLPPAGAAPSSPRATQLHSKDGVADPCPGRGRGASHRPILPGS